MKFYNSIGPNPRVVRMFMAEKGLSVARVDIDIIGGENRQPAYMAKNPTGESPALELDDGFVLAEVTVICEYLEELHPTPVLIGANPRDRAETRMWVRRIDLAIVEPMVRAFRYAEGLAMFQTRMHCIPQAADDLKSIAREKLAWLDSQVEGRTWICGNRFTLADIFLFAMLDFAAQVGQGLDPANRTLTEWFARVKARASVPASA